MQSEKEKATGWELGNKKAQGLRTFLALLSNGKKKQETETAFGIGNETLKSSQLHMMKRVWNWMNARSANTPTTTCRTQNQEPCQSRFWQSRRGAFAVRCPTWRLSKPSHSPVVGMDLFGAGGGGGGGGLSPEEELGAGGGCCSGVAWGYPGRLPGREVHFQAPKLATCVAMSSWIFGTRRLSCVADFLRARRFHLECQQVPCLTLHLQDRQAWNVSASVLHLSKEYCGGLQTWLAKTVQIWSSKQAPRDACEL